MTLFICTEDFNRYTGLVAPSSAYAALRYYKEHKPLSPNIFVGRMISGHMDETIHYFVDTDENGCLRVQKVGDFEEGRKEKVRENQG